MNFLKTELTISDKLYFESFAVRKKIVSASFHHPILKKTVCHKFHLAELEPRPNKETFNQELQDIKRNKYSFTVDKTDLTTELGFFVQEPRKNPIYFYFEVCDELKKIPLYYASIYSRDSFAEDDPIITQNFEKQPDWFLYINECHKELSDYIYMEKIHPSYYYDLFTFFHDFGFSVHEWLDKENSTYVDEPLDIQWLEKSKRRFERFKDKAMRSYALAVLNSVVEQALQNQDFIKCHYCGRLIDYHKGKRYCSLVSEKRDCAKKARNKRYYEQTGQQHLDTYRNKTKELRTFYKERDVKK